MCVSVHAWVIQICLHTHTHTYTQWCTLTTECLIPGDSSLDWWVSMVGFLLLNQKADAITKFSSSGLEKTPEKASNG